VPSQGFQIFSDVIVEKRIGSALTSALMKTILVTAYPDDDVRARALNDGVVCYLRKPDEKHLVRCLRAALHSDKPYEENS
jgi:CheY-like chemotaxis protein